MVLVTTGQRFWIVEGQRLSPSAGHDLEDNAERERFERLGGVRVTTGPLGTEIKWSAFSPCFASLFHLLSWLPESRGPFVLRYYLCGWFEEFVETSEEARDRIEQVIGKSEMRITRRAFVEAMDNSRSRLPNLIQKTISDPKNVDDISIKCFYDERSQRFRVSHIGPNSTIARFYGMEPVVYPYVNGGSYDEIVCEAYKEVLNSGKSRYDQVLAAMRMPNNIIHWMPYHRFIIPNAHEKGRDSVTVVTEIAPVEFRIV